MTMEPVGPAWLMWLEHSALAVAMRNWIWLYPIVEIVHILGIVLLAGSTFMFDLRLLGLSRHVRVTDMARHLLPRAGVPRAVVGRDRGGPPVGLFLGARSTTNR